MAGPDALARIEAEDQLFNCFTSVYRDEALAAARDFADLEGVKLGTVAQPLRAALTGSHASPGIFDVMAALGRDETLARMADAS